MIRTYGIRVVYVHMPCLDMCGLLLTLDLRFCSMMIDICLVRGKDPRPTHLPRGMFEPHYVSASWLHLISFLFRF